MLCGALWCFVLCGEVGIECRGPHEWRFIRFRFIPPGHLDPLVIIVVGLLRCTHTPYSCDWRLEKGKKKKKKGRYTIYDIIMYDTRNDLHNTTRDHVPV